MNKSTKTVIITGATGLLGTVLVDYFNNLEWRVIAFVRKIPKERKKNVLYEEYHLEEEVDEKHFEGVDYLIHSAYLPYKKANNSDLINYEGTERLLNVCSMTNTKMIFLSSFSSHNKALSHYGIHKFACEKLFEKSNHAVAKISFIIWNKGILKEMISKMTSSKFFPLIDRGRQPLQSIWIADLCKSIQIILEKDLNGVYYLGSEEVVTMKTFYKELANKKRLNTIFVPIPSSLLLVACKCLEFLKVEIPVSSENILGLRKMRSFDTLKSQKQLDFYFNNYKNSLQKVIG